METFLPTTEPCKVSFAQADGEAAGTTVRPATDVVRSVGIDRTPVPSIFHQPWWLELASGGDYDMAEVVDGGRRTAWMPYVVSRRRGFRVSVLPELAHCLGPVVDEGEGGLNHRLRRRMDLHAQLASRLPKVAFFSQTCHPDIDDVLGFQASGFDASVQFSSEIAPVAPDLAWRGLRDKTRNVIRRAGEQLELGDLDDAQEFAGFYRRNLALANERCYFNLDLIPRLFQAARARGQARIAAARRGGTLVAAVFYVWDHRRLWYFLSSRRDDEPNNGAVSILIWDGIRQACGAGLVFDFDGIASAGAARFYTGFGAQRRQRFVIHRRNALFGVCSTLLDTMRDRNRIATP